MEARPCGCGIEFRSNIKVNKSESEGTSSNNIVVIKCRELSCEHIGDNTRTAKRCCATRQTACLYLLKEKPQFIVFAECRKNEFILSITLSYIAIYKGKLAENAGWQFYI